MHPHRHNPPTIEDTAADWLLRSDRGLKAAEERELAKWLAADPRHEAAFLAIEETWHRLGKVQPENSPSAAPVIRHPRRGRRLVSLAAAAMVLLTTVLGWHAWRGSHDRYTLNAQTEVGGLREVALLDGSIIRLNTDTEVSVSYTKNERRVALRRGEAHFTVAKHPARPFIVSAEGIDVLAVGTVFNVRLRGFEVDVLVTEGRVRLADMPDSSVPASPPRTVQAELGAGERTTIALNQGSFSAPTVVPVAPMEMRHALAWQEKRLDFYDVPLGDMIEEINRYSREKLAIDDPALRAERFGGSFPAGDTESVVRMLVRNFDVVTEKRDATTVLRWRPHPPP